MIRIAIFAGGNIGTFQRDFSFFVGVDRACIFLIENNLPLDLAVGDFDSVSSREFDQIKATATELIQLASEKNDTDLHLAVESVFKRFPNSYVTIYGAFGGRLDQELSNIFLPSNSKIAPFLRNIRLLDDQNTIYFRSSGIQVIHPLKDRKYISFMLSERIPLTITGAKYSLNEHNYFFRTIYSSNEFINEEPITVAFNSGYLVIIYSRDRR